ncbi:ATP-binding protein [Breoghania sp.]|uniref:ATP-binding protein n=1 Tax=Breoghania sp. TaxID=2065378 RepID=UPI00263661FB|nr:ATP-binding protein [Breoghania sp.]MDJ0932759.1 ATP-binding protein [Breoghania sp.]
MPSTADDFELYDVFARIRSTVVAQAESKGLHFALRVSARTPQRLTGDARHLADILTNLAGNAVKFTDTGSVVVAVSQVYENKGCANETVRLRFEVTDTGIGIAEEAQSRIFEHFSQADDTIINRFGGTGLGLAIVKRLVELYGRDIGVESVQGKGSTFWFELSFERAQSKEPDLPRLATGADHRADPGRRAGRSAAGHFRRGRSVADVDGSSGGTGQSHAFRGQERDSPLYRSAG